MMSGTARTLLSATVAVLALVAVVAVGVQQGKEPSMDRPVETRGELERLKKERLNQAASTSVRDGTTN